jgi:type VI secretion system VasD/TssJ family lipoprotein
LAASLSVCVGACSWFRPAPPPLFPVDLCLRSDPQAQQYKGKAHTLYVRLYPLVIADAFSATDVAKLLADPPPALSGAVGTPQSRTLRPGANDKAKFDVADGQPFAFIGVVAGYYDLKGSAKKVVPVEELRKEGCYTVDFGPSGITGGASVPVPTVEP